MSIIAVCSGKGSPGCTFTAINLASALSTSRQVLLIDLDPHGADAGAYLGLDPRSGLYPLMRLEGKLPTAEALDREAQAVHRFRVVAGFPRAQDVDPEMIKGVLEAAKSRSGLVIVDLGRITPDSAHLANNADLVLLVSRADVVGVYGANRGIEMLNRAGCESSRIFGVVSGWEWRRSGDLSEAVDAIRAPVAGSIPLDKREARRALLAQEPLQSGRALKAFKALAGELESTPTPVPAREEVSVS